VVAVAFRSLLRMCSGSSGAYNLTVRSSRRRFMASCYLSVSGCCRFGCTSLRRGLTQVLATTRPPLQQRSKLERAGFFNCAHIGSKIPEVAFPARALQRVAAPRHEVQERVDHVHLAINPCRSLEQRIDWLTHNRVHGFEHAFLVVKIAQAFWQVFTML